MAYAQRVGPSTGNSARTAHSADSNERWTLVSCSFSHTLDPSQLYLALVNMKCIALAAAALAAASSLVSAAPTKRGFFPEDGPAFIGQLVSYPETIQLGENFTISYDSNVRPVRRRSSSSCAGPDHPSSLGSPPLQDPSPDPSYPSSIQSFDVGIQGPAPIYYSSVFTPSGILELANDLPGQQVVNASLKMSSSADPGQYCASLAVASGSPTAQRAAS